MNRNSVAASARKNREAHPELYCPVRNCLWRLSGGPCPKLGHAKAAAKVVPCMALAQPVAAILDAAGEI